MHYPLVLLFPISPLMGWDTLPADPAWGGVVRMGWCEAQEGERWGRWGGTRIEWGSVGSVGGGLRMGDVGWGVERIRWGRDGGHPLK